MPRIASKYLLISLLSSATLFGCTPKIIDTPGGPVTCYSSKCVNEANEFSSSYYRQIKIEDEAKQLALQKEEQERKNMKELNEWYDWQKNNPAEADQKKKNWEEYLRNYSTQLNSYGCPGNTRPFGPPMYGCGYPQYIP